MTSNFPISRTKRFINTSHRLTSYYRHLLWTQKSYPEDLFSYSSVVLVLPLWHAASTLPLSAEQLLNWLNSSVTGCKRNYVVRDVFNMLVSNIEETASACLHLQICLVSCIPYRNSNKQSWPGLGHQKGLTTLYITFIGPSIIWCCWGRWLQPGCQQPALIPTHHKRTNSRQLWYFLPVKKP